MHFYINLLLTLLLFNIIVKMQVIEKTSVSIATEEKQYTCKYIALKPFLFLNIESYIQSIARFTFADYIKTPKRLFLSGFPYELP